jgi:hypothetical protein
MKRVEIKEDFGGYPNGKDLVEFAAGDTVEVSDAFAELIVGKGHAIEVKATETATNKSSNTTR